MKKKWCCCLRALEFLLYPRCLIPFNSSCCFLFYNAEFSRLTFPLFDSFCFILQILFFSSTLRYEHALRKLSNLMSRVFSRCLFSFTKCNPARWPMDSAAILAFKSGCSLLATSILAQGSGCYLCGQRGQANSTFRM